MNLIIYEKINLTYTSNLSNLIFETEIKNNKYFYRFIHFFIKIYIILYNLFPILINSINCLLNYFIICALFEIF